MKKIILGVFFPCLLLQFCHLEKVNTSTEYECLLVASKQAYILGETPILEVSIKNNSGKDIYLIGNLDGSEHKFRMPFCYFEIENPINDSLPLPLACANVNAIRKKDFVLVTKGDTFNPYYKLNGYNLSQMLENHNFKQVGKYRISFHYSTKSSNMDDYSASTIYGSRSRHYKRALAPFFELVPSIELESNTIEIEIIDFPPSR